MAEVMPAIHFLFMEMDSIMIPYLNKVPLI